MTDLQAIAFDAYGTLCQITERTNPFADLLTQSNLSRDEARLLCMTRNLSLAELIHDLLPAHDTGINIAALESKVQREVDSVQLFPDVPETLTALKSRGLKLAVVSNLASPYANPVQRLLGDSIDHFIWSFEVGAIKPEAAIFDEVCHRLSVSPAQVLMVGDSLTADIAGAQNYGMQAIHLDRSGKSNSSHSITSLTELL